MTKRDWLLGMLFYTTENAAKSAGASRHGTQYLVPCWIYSVGPYIGGSIVVQAKWAPLQLWVYLNNLVFGKANSGWQMMWRVIDLQKVIK